MRRFAAAFVLLYPLTVSAQWWLGTASQSSGTEACQRENTWVVNPDQVDSFTVQFQGRTLNATPTPVVAVSAIKSVQADATPGQIVTAGPSVSGSSVTVKLNPDNGCGSPGCRIGNVYQIDVRPTDSAGNEPTAAGCVVVRDTKLSPQ